ncbi:FdhF/YdeP family oxidoreductase [Roseisolibacter sp. H3M3-2]|uniref:FdhF/YdeP family oxidoreductase n=1 Tax=Roseisolibacter sp. H3M3-2 TaxID=3031323 RepID=UPI0023DA58D0|nr:FdhF/YdeP family oxidoreductase [Roseisolibacter sp. H3M3-2]MDF1502225.1 FdhF/YdeP family oxidoreductase [Roseisolibacter sp. H3M3-2]
MSDQDTPLPSALTPDEVTGPRVGRASEVAAGVAAVVKTTQWGLREMGAARSLKTLLAVNQVDGFDCQSCAWPSPNGTRHTAEFCENGAKAVADAGTRKRVTPEFFGEHSVADLAARSDHWLNAQGRLTHPMLLREGGTHYEPVSWDDAFAIVADELRALDTPDAAAFYTSGRTSNEAAFLYQLFVRQLGTNNLPDCSNMCHESSGVALGEAIGVGKGTVTLEDFERADAIWIFGQNPGTNHPRMLASLEQAKANGATIVSVNPLPEVGTRAFANPQHLHHPWKALPVLLGKGTALTDLFVPVRINGDVAFLQGVMKEMLAEEDARPGAVFDAAFIRDHTVGYEAFAESLRAADWDVIVEQSGATRAQIREAAEIAMRSERMICCWAMGLTQHRNAVDTIQEVVNLLLLGGHLGRPGAGACPVRGHSNVQGDRTMGIAEKMPDAFLDRLGTEFAFSPPRHHGADTVETIRRMHDGRITVLFAMGGNFLSATPDTAYTAEALRRCALTAHVSTKLNRAHLVTGRRALILPCLDRSEHDVQPGGEQFVTVEDSMGIVNPSRGVLPPASAHLLSEPRIVARLARAALGDRTTVPWEALADDYDRVRERIARVVPGFADFDARIRRGPFYLYNPVRDDRRFDNGVGKARFTVHEIPRHDLPPGQYLMMTIRTHDQFNTVVYGLDDRYRGIYGGRRVVFMNRDDMAEAGLAQGDLVDLTSHFEGETRTAPRWAVVPYPIPRRCTATYFPEGNVLVPVRSVAARSNTPTSKSVRISVARSAPS